MGVKDRLIEFMKYKGVSQRTLETQCGLSNGFVDKVGEGTRQSSLDKISAQYPELNILWLRTGYGEMLLESEAASNKVHSLVPDHENQSTVVSLLPISAQGGSLNDFVVSVKSEDCEKIISPIKGIDFAITVAGDSMSPEYPNGSQILIKKINEKAFIDWGRAYVLDTCNGTVVKKIMPGSDPKKVKCISVNPDYPPFEVNFSDIYGMYRVMMCMAIK